MTPIPGPVARVADLMSTFRPTWSLCGGWGIDAWLGSQTRDHEDVDISVFGDDQRTVFAHLSDWDLIGHEDQLDPDTSERWDGRSLGLPAHIHARAHDDFQIEVLLNERKAGDWIFSRDPVISMPVGESIRLSGWRLPTAVPEVLLLLQGHRVHRLRGDGGAECPR